MCALNLNYTHPAKNTPRKNSRDLVSALLLKVWKKYFTWSCIVVVNQGYAFVRIRVKYSMFCSKIKRRSTTCSVESKVHVRG